VRREYDRANSARRGVSDPDCGEQSYAGAAECNIDAAILLFLAASDVLELE
jgi:hypothetical protein